MKIAWSKRLLLIIRCRTRCIGLTIQAFFLLIMFKQSRPQLFIFLRFKENSGSGTYGEQFGHYDETRLHRTVSYINWIIFCVCLKKHEQSLYISNPWIISNTIYRIVWNHRMWKCFPKIKLHRKLFRNDFCVHSVI